MVSSGLWKMLYLPKIMLSTDGTIGYVMSGTWCQNGWHPNDDAAGPHAYSIDPHLQFIQETLNTDGSSPFLDTLVLPGPDNTLITSVYRNLHIQTSTYTGRAITTYVLTIVCSVLSHVVLGQCLPTLHCYTRKTNT